jgi:serine/threonine-protein kinase
MEHVAGVSLRQLLLHRGRLPIAAAIRIARCIADALSYLHEGVLSSALNASIVHRDVRPENVLLASSGAVKLIDFEHSSPEGSETDAGPLDQDRIGYAAPEVLVSRVVDRRSDVWALGVLLYEALTGALPFEHSSSNDLLEAQLSKRWTGVEQLGSDVGALASIVARALDPNLSARFQSGSELSEALADLESDGEQVLAGLVAQMRSPPDSRPAIVDATGPSSSVALHVAPAPRSLEQLPVSPLADPGPVDWATLDLDEPYEAPPRPRPRWATSKPFFLTALGLSALMTIALLRVLGLEVALDPGASDHRVLSAPELTPIHSTLEPDVEHDALLSISTIQRARVEIDGRALGEAPEHELPLVHGVHRLTLRPLDSGSGLHTMELPVELGAHAGTRLRVDLRTGHVSQLSMDLGADDR